jgi:hypothetical protein
MGLDQVKVAMGSITDTAGLMLHIKPSSAARYGGVVDLLDEFALAGLAHYQVADSMSGEERASIVSTAADRSLR